MLSGEGRHYESRRRARLKTSAKSERKSRCGHGSDRCLDDGADECLYIRTAHEHKLQGYSDTAFSFSLYFITASGRAGAPAMRIPLVEVKTPVETLARSRRCQYTYGKAFSSAACAVDSQVSDYPTPRSHWSSALTIQLPGSEATILRTCSAAC